MSKNKISFDFKSTKKKEEKTPNFFPYGFNVSGELKNKLLFWLSNVLLIDKSF